MAKFYMVVNLSDLSGGKVADYTRKITAPPTMNFTALDVAEAHARHLAAQKVGNDVVIFESTHTIVASNPTYSRKEFTESGELIPAKKA